jgi:endoglucanase
MHRLMTAALAALSLGLVLISHAHAAKPVPTNGICGSADGVPVSSAPTGNLCAAGTASSVTGTGPWDWNCAGSTIGHKTGSTDYCYAPLLVAASPSGTTIPSATQIVDSIGTVWTVVSGQAVRNGVVDTTTANIVQLLYYNGVIYQQATAQLLWWSWSDATGWAEVSGDPRVGTTTGAALPSGYLHVVGNQIVSTAGANVRLACVGYEQLTGNPTRDTSQMRAIGFNCLRPDVSDRDTCPNGVCSFTGLDAIVNAATAAGMKVIISHHSNEGSASGGNCASQQANGLWYDLNDNTVVDGVAWNTLSGSQNGCGTAGTVTYSRFKANSVAIAAHYAGNTTVIGHDLWNEPIVGNPICVQPGCQATILNWGGNNGSDIQMMCNKVGNAIETAAPGVLIICEGPINVSGHFLNGAAFPSGLDNIADLTKAQTNPVVVTSGGLGRLVYSVHDYPNSVNGSIQAQSGTAFVTNRNTAWGFLEINNFAPVWIGENGCSCDNSNGQGLGENQWAAALTAYLNGQAAGGPTFAAGKQPMGQDWWWFGYGPGQQIDGIYADSALTILNAAQKPYWGALLYSP